MHSGKKWHDHNHGKFHTVSHFSFFPRRQKWPATKRNHGDGSLFDGTGGILAHDFVPTDGRFHYDANEQWSVGERPRAFDLETVALHEIGHLLGLRHSSVEGAIMFSSISSGMKKGLHGDDIQGIKALYNT
ncbi:Metalloendoproteinase 1 [Morella rubra]|uniref:Metalloendoproteinase 1 n=1 Tax=Morella rubra TaxID=262757 RepID=A0A6A1V8B5_9ROSI|nr:Metalloendoproteinase 1 [Morella rubra]